jgi:glutathione S-transferase
MEAAVGIIYEKRFRPEHLWWPDWHEAQWAKIDRALDAIERSWLSHLEGPGAHGPDRRGLRAGVSRPALPGTRLAQGSPGLTAWEATFAARPSMTSTAPPTA